jgi:hypothetical protein
MGRALYSKKKPHTKNQPCLCETRWKEAIGYQYLTVLKSPALCLAPIVVTDSEPTPFVAINLSLVTGGDSRYVADSMGTAVDASSHLSAQSLGFNLAHHAANRVVFLLRSRSFWRS